MMSDDKTHISIVITLNTINEAQLCKNDLFIKGIKIKTNMFNSIKPSHQCEKCMKFEHTKTNCKNTVTCSFCALTHDTNNHKLGYHPMAWRECTGIVLKKPNRPDYTIFKT